VRGDGVFEGKEEAADSKINQRIVGSKNLVGKLPLRTKVQQTTRKRGGKGERNEGARRQEAM